MNGYKGFGVAMIVGAAALLTAAPQAAAQTELAAQNGQRYSQQAMQQALRFVDELEVHGQRIMTEALQVAMQIDQQESLRRVQESREFFVTVLHTLQRGDPSIGLPVPESEDLIAELEALQQIWDQLDVTVTGIIRTGNASRTDIILLSEFDNILVDISRQVETAYEHHFSRSNLSSMAVTTVVKAEHQSFLIERMQSEILLINYGHDVEEQRRQLTDSAAIFERTLEGLIAGDPANRLMPPPRTEIKSQLRNVQRIWDEVAPTIERITDGGSIDVAGVTEIVSRMEPMFEQMEFAVDLYAPQVEIMHETLDPIAREPDSPPNA